MLPDEVKPPVEIPADQLSHDAIAGIVESFILREGTDYGANEVSLEKKKEQIHRQISKKEIKIVFDPNTESVTLMTESQWKRAQAPL
ncbi:MAG TPA: YheU family protein [Bdellovibrio sp.]|uniref:YheU family protein n=1 Tax=Bdellovibrio sp. TaxID=28201 RepID=UPI002EF2BB4A